MGVDYIYIIIFTKEVIGASNKTKTCISCILIPALTNEDASVTVFGQWPVSSPSMAEAMDCTPRDDIFRIPVNSISVHPSIDAVVKSTKSSERGSADGAPSGTSGSSSRSGKIKYGSKQFCALTTAATPANKPALISSRDALFI